MDRKRLAVTNKLSANRTRTPYDRPSRRLRPDSRQRDTERDHAVEEQSPGLMSRIKGLLSPRKWISPKHHTTHLEESLLQDAELSTPRPSTNNALLYTHRIDGSPRRTPQPKTPLLDDSESPNHRLIEFFRAKGDAPLTDVEREGVLALIQKASDTNQSVLDLTPKRKEALVKEIKQSGTSSSPKTRQHDPVPWDLPFRSSPNTPVRLSPIQSPKYSPLYSTGKHHEDRSILGSQDSSFRKTPVQKSSPNQHFSIPTPYKRKSGNSIVETASKFHFALPTKSSLAHSIEPAPKPISSPRQLSQTASMLSSLLDENKPEKDEEDNINSSNIYATPVSKPEMKSSIEITPNRQNEGIVTEISRGNTAERHTPSRGIETDTASSIMKKTPKFTPRISHAYQPARSSGLRQAVTVSPVKSITATKASSPVKKEPFKFDFAASTESAMKKAPGPISPSKPLFGNSPVVERKSQNTHFSTNKALLTTSFEFPILPAETGPILTAAEEKKLEKFRDLYSF